jgi:hypothetical protein
MTARKPYQMHPPSTLCRAQEAHYRSRADGASLDNVRVVAERAATAWAREAVVAERREARRSQEDTFASPSLSVPGPPDEVDRAHSENPDRGFADS